MKKKKLWERERERNNIFCMLKIWIEWESDKFIVRGWE